MKLVKLLKIIKYLILIKIKMIFLKKKKKYFNYLIIISHLIITSKKIITVENMLSNSKELMESLNEFNKYINYGDKKNILIITKMNIEIKK